LNKSLHCYKLRSFRGKNIPWNPIGPTEASGN